MTASYSSDAADGRINNRAAMPQQQAISINNDDHADSLIIVTSKPLTTPLLAVSAVTDGTSSSFITASSFVNDSKWNEHREEMPALLASEQVGIAGDGEFESSAAHQEDDEKEQEDEDELHLFANESCRCISTRMHLFLGGLLGKVLCLLFDLGIFLLLMLIAQWTTGTSLWQLPHDAASFSTWLLDLLLMSLFRSLNTVFFMHCGAHISVAQMRRSAGFAINTSMGCSLLMLIFLTGLSLQLVLFKQLFQVASTASITMALMRAHGLLNAVTQVGLACCVLISRRRHIVLLCTLLRSDRKHELKLSSQSSEEFIQQLIARLESTQQAHNWNKLQREFEEREERERQRLEAQLELENERDSLFRRRALGQQSAEDVQRAQEMRQMQQKESFSKSQIVWRLLDLWRDDALLLTVAFVFMVAAAITGLTIPSYTGALLASVLGGELDMKQMYIWLALIFLTGLCTQLRGWIFTVAGERFSARLRCKLFSHCLMLDVEFFDRSKIGDLSSILTSDADIVRDSISLNVNVFLRSIIAIVGAMAYMLILNWRLSLVAFASLPIFMGLSLLYGDFEKKQSTKVQELTASANALAIQAFGAIKTVLAYDSATYERSNYATVILESRLLAIKKAFVYGFYANATSVLADLGSWSTLLYGFHLLHDGSIGVTDLSQFLFFSSYLVSNLSNVAWVAQGLMKSFGSAERIFRLLDCQPRIWSHDLHHSSPSSRSHNALQLEQQIMDRKRRLRARLSRPAEVTVRQHCFHTLLPPIALNYLKPPQPFSGHIRFHKVCFAYPSARHRTVLREISFEIKPGQTVAFVGSSGCGKSSLVSLLTRCYDVTAGSIELDGIDIRLLAPSWCRRNIGFVQQEAVIYARSIAQNIQYGLTDDECDAAAVEFAAQQAHAHDFIMRLPQGYATVLNERASLSGGQKQRISIARALARKPHCLIFDEATSALDAKSERAVQAAIDSICASKDKSVLLIAHRLSTIQHVDCIFVMEQGEIVEIGKHHQLLAAKGTYHSLILAQMSGGSEDNAPAFGSPTRQRQQQTQQPIQPLVHQNGASSRRSSLALVADDEQQVVLE